MLKPQNLFRTGEITQYIPAVLHEQKCGQWKIEYYALNPQTKELERVRIKVNKIRNAYSKKQDARRHCSEIIQQINAKLMGGWSPFFEGEDSRLYVPLKEVCELFIAERSRELRPDTMRSYSSFCKGLTEWADKNTPKIFCSMFNHNYAIRYMDFVFNQKKVSAVTYNNTRKTGIIFFNWAIEKCYTKQNAFDKIKPKRKEDKKRTIIPYETRQKITDHYTQTKNYGMLLVCNLVYSSLIRPKEIRNLKIENVNIAEKYITVPSEVAKNHKQRLSALSENSITILEKYLAGKTCKKDYYLIGGVMGNLHPTKEIAYDSVFQHEWQVLRKVLKIPMEMQLYSFRDTGIFEMLKSGIDDLSVMQHADHSDLSITTRYANHFDKNLIKKINENVPDF